MEEDADNQDYRHFSDAGTTTMQHGLKYSRNESLTRRMLRYHGLQHASVEEFSLP